MATPAETPAVGPAVAPDIVAPDDVAAATRKADDALSQQYEVVKLLAEDTWLVRRKEDPDAQFLGYPDDLNATAPQLAALLGRGARWALDALLNHPNLICPADAIRWGPLLDNGAGAAPRRLMLWDYCDAGSLRGFMDRTEVPVQVDPETNMACKWLPESLCWHVVTSVLRALAWLHEGHREADTIEEGLDGKPTRGAKSDTRQGRGEDWLSVLHRDVSTYNIYFQHPRATETYGLCKLGNYGKVFVSGHVNDWSTGHVVCSGDGEEPLLQVIQDVKEQDIYKINKTKRPYFKGTDVYHLGEVLHMMMTRQAIPDKEECPNCSVRHWTQTSEKECAAWPAPLPFDLEALLLVLEKGYSVWLVGVLRTLLSHHRASVETAALFIHVMEGYLQWKEETPEGRRHRDYWDDMVTRNENSEKKHAEDKKNAQAQSAPGAVDYVQLAMQWAQDNANVGVEDEAAPTAAEVAS